MLRFWLDTTRAQRSAFIAAWLGWILDAFDFTVFLLAMPDIGREMHIDKAALGVAVTATLLGRTLGGPLGGWLSDRFGRRRPMMASLVAYAFFDVLVGFCGTFPPMLVLRFLFGVGMGAEWSSGTALVMEHWPAKTRGLASGLLQGSWAIGYFTAAAAYRLLVPHLGWRALFWMAAAPALLAVYVRARVSESPSWSNGPTPARAPSPLDLFRDREATKSVVVGSVVLGGGFFTYYSLATFYPSLLDARHVGVERLALLVMIFNFGMLAGSVACGALSERVGRRAAIALFGASTIAAAWLYLMPQAPILLAVGAFVGGFVGVGWTGATPSYLAEHFDARVRGLGVGTAYHVGALVGAASPIVVPALERRGVDLANAMALCACAGAAVVAIAVWARPERRGANL